MAELKKPVTFDQWPSRSDKPIPWNPSKRVIADTPQFAPADITALVKNPPKSMPELIRGMIGKGTKNKGFVIGDNHSNSGYEILAEPASIAELKAAKAIALLERTPEELTWAREPTRGGTASMHDFASSYTGIGALVRTLDKADILVVPMDMYGPDLMAMKKAQDEILRNAPKDDTAELHIANELIKFSKTDLSKDFFRERARVTEAVWAERSAEVMKKHPDATFVAVGGTLHVDVAPDTKAKGEVYDQSFAMMLSKRLGGASIPTVSYQSYGSEKPRTLLPKTMHKKTKDGRVIATDLEFNLPGDLSRQMANSKAYDSPNEELSNRAFVEANRMDYTMKDFIVAYDRMLDTTKRKPAKEDYAAIKGLLDAKELMLAGKNEEALKLLKPVAMQVEALKAVHKGEAVQPFLKAMDEQLKTMNEAIGYMEMIRNGKMPPEEKKEEDKNTSSALPSPASKRVAVEVPQTISLLDGRSTGRF